jgi:hypothetical protein
MTEPRSALGTVGFKSAVGDPTLTRAGIGLAAIGKGGNSFQNAQCVRVRGRVRGKVRRRREACLAYGRFINCSHPSQEAESYGWRCIQREGSLGFEIPLFPEGAKS